LNKNNIQLFISKLFQQRRYKKIIKIGEKKHIFYIIIYSEGDAGPFFGFLNLELKYGGFL
jgi:hypothetical protein